MRTLATADFFNARGGKESGVQSARRIGVSCQPQTLPIKLCAYPSEAETIRNAL